MIRNAIKKSIWRYINKISILQLLDNISDHQNIAFGDAENGCLWSFQNTDNQYRYNHKITPNSTGKELDQETGYSYFGARYLDHTLTTAWLSVDPMADKYPNISPYAYCAWNPLKLVDPKGNDVEIVKDDDNKTVTIRANFYYNKENLGAEADVFLAGFQDAINSWSDDIKEALKDESLGASGYSVSFEFSFYESDNPEKSAENDCIGNSLKNDPDYYSAEAVVTNNKYFKANIQRHSHDNNPDAFDPLFYSTNNPQGTLKHEIGHIFGLYDRYPEAKKPAPTIPNDLMHSDIMNRNNAVEPFKRVWRSAELDKGKTRAIINHNNKEKL